MVSVYPITDDYEEKDIKKAVDALKGEEFDALVICIAGWIPTHAVVKITEHFRHIPIAGIICAMLQSIKTTIGVIQQKKKYDKSKNFKKVNY